MTLMSIPQMQDFSDLRVDFHSHTKFSDGGLTPQELIDRAVNFQLDVLAITDHDTVSALAVAQAHIEQNKLPLTLINGIEISCAWQSFEIHIVGLNIRPDNKDLNTLITKQKEARENRALKMAEKLTKCGIDNVYEPAKALAEKGTITRAHFAKVLLQQGHVSTMQAAFDKYIGRGNRAFVKPQWCDVSEAVKAIHAAGGVAVIAHPVRYGLSTKWLRRLVVDFKNAGGNALEVVLPQMGAEQRKLMLSFCAEYDLLASAGSDFHYPSRWSDLGRNLTMPADVEPIWTLFTK